MREALVVVLLGLAALLVVLPGGALLAEETGGGGQPPVKQNLDLPYSPLEEPQDEEAAPELIVFYGEQYEGQGVFFCCGTSGICRT